MNKIEFDKKEMKNALALLAKAKARKNTLPILDFVLIEQDKFETRLTVCNMETQNTTWTRVTVTTAGTKNPAPAFTLHFKSLRYAINETEKPFIEVKDTGDEDYPAVIIGDNGKYPRVIIVDTLPASEFPPFPERKMIDTLWLGPQFGEAVKTVLPALSTDIARPTLTYVHVKNREGWLNFEACDGFVLLRKDMMLFTPDIDFLIPTLASKLIATRAYYCNVTLGDDYLFYSDPPGIGWFGMDIAAAVENNHYPDTDQIIRKVQDTDTRLKFLPESWTPILKSAVKTCKQAETAYAIRITANEAVHLDTPGLRMNAELPGAVLNVGKTPMIGMNPAFLERLLSGLDPEKPLQISWDAPTTPAIITGKDTLSLIMPVHMDDSWWEAE